MLRKVVEFHQQLGMFFCFYPILVCWDFLLFCGTLIIYDLLVKKYQP